jgi:pyruvate-ferredoxin/flavodoxin oxidoreductase
MAQRKMVPHDGNSACAHVAHAVNEVIAIYPITPSSGLGEIADEKSSRGEKNIWGTVPSVTEMQSEAGAAGAVHGALATGALTTTFTASQGLLLMIPNMFKIAGELTPTAFHVTARAVACQALSIFGDHSDVMAVRQTGWGLFCSSTVQEAMDFALIAQAATLESRIPFVHFYDGFRTSHEIQKIEELTFDDMRAMIDDNLVAAMRTRALSPDHPTIKGTSQNPDVFFQGRETVNKYYTACSAIVQKNMDKFAKLTGRQYKLYEYIGAPDAERIIVCMGSGCDTVHETVDAMNKQGAKVGILKVRLFRPFSMADFIKALPASVKKIAVLDRTKEPGAMGEPLYEDIRTAVGEAMQIKITSFKEYPAIIGGRYGLGSAEFNPAMVKGIFEELAKPNPKNHFSIGISDNVTNASIDYDPSYSLDGADVHRSLFYGLGSDGTVGANHNSIRIIAEKTGNNAQAYFSYDSKKAGAITVSHLRFGKNLIRKPYLITKANFIACHNFSFLEKYDMLKNLEEGGTFLLTSEFDKNAIWEELPGFVQQQIINKKINFYIIDAMKIASGLGLGSRINVIMQTAFFEISKVIDSKVAIEAIKDATRKSYGKKGEAIVNMNIAAIDQAVSGIQKVTYPNTVTKEVKSIEPVSSDAPDFVKNVTSKMMKQEGQTITVAEMPDDGTWPVGTTQYEKRNIAQEIPVWNPLTCIQCHRCSLICPHATIRPKAYDAKYLEKAPKTFKSIDAKGPELKGLKYTMQVAPEDCTGCGECVDNCPTKGKGDAILMKPQAPLRHQEAENFAYFLSIPDTDAKLFKADTVKGSQFLKPMFEFSGACAGCGETAYVKLISQLFGDRAIITNATGCSSIYGGNLPTTPYTTRADGRGPTWMNSLFEDNAEAAMGARLTVDKFNEYAKELVAKMIADGSCDVGLKTVLGEIVAAPQTAPSEIETVRAKVAVAKAGLVKNSGKDCAALLPIIDYLVKKSVWAFGGDGWAYDIGYGGLDHVLASGKNVNILVLDTEVYSNTGGQSSKSTPMGAVAKFAASGKPVSKKDMGLMAISYGYIYVAKIALGANQNQAIKAIVEAEAYNGPSLVLCYSHCIAHGIDMTTGYGEQKKAVESGHWPLYRFNPELEQAGKNPLQLDSKDPSIQLADFESGENRFQILKRSKPEISQNLLETAQKNITAKFKLLKQLASREM